MTTAKVRLHKESSDAQENMGVRQNLSTSQNNANASTPGQRPPAPAQQQVPEMDQSSSAARARVQAILGLQPQPMSNIPMAPSGMIYPVPHVWYPPDKARQDQAQLLLAAHHVHPEILTEDQLSIFIWQPEFIQRQSILLFQTFGADNLGIIPYQSSSLGIAEVQAYRFVNPEGYQLLKDGCQPPLESLQPPPLQYPDPTQVAQQASSPYTPGSDFPGLATLEMQAPSNLAPYSPQGSESERQPYQRAKTGCLTCRARKLKVSDL
jgi:hypothetical protein